MTLVRSCQRKVSQTLRASWWAAVLFLLLAFTSAQAATIPLVPTGADWNYLDNGSDQQTSWTSLEFNDTSWASGPAQLGYGDGDEATPLLFGSDPNNKFTTYYFRHAFSVSEASSYTNLVVRLLRDDGGIVYLNGIEIFRSNMPQGPILYTDFASSAVPVADESTHFYEETVNPSLLLEGPNLIAVEIHQANLTSSDISFDLSLLGENTDPPSPSALQFDGINDYVTFGTAPELALAAVTIETWFKRTGPGIVTSSGSGGIDNALPLVAKGRGEADGDNRDMNYMLAIRTTDNVLAADFEEGAGGPSPGLNHPIYGVTPIQLNVWYHAAATYDGSQWQLFLDGNLEAELTVNRPLRADSIQHASLASALQSSGQPAGYFQGILDEARIWDQARTSQQISQSMDQEIPSAPGLVGRWGLNEGSGPSATDSSGNDLTGTLVNGPIWVTGQLFNSPPDINIIAPLDGATFVAPADVPIETTVSDADGSVTTVAFFKGTTLLAEVPVSPFNFTWINPSPGYYPLTAIATDDSGLSTTSSVVNVVVHNSIVQITNPTNNTHSLIPTNITLSATASDADGPILLVEFFADQLKVGEDDASPYSTTWDNVPIGIHRLTAVTTDNGGIMNTSAPVALFVIPNSPPNVNIIAPAENASFTVSGNLTLVASAIDPDGTVVSVEFYQDGNSLGQDTTPPYEADWNNLPIGDHILTALATDDRGATSTSPPIHIVVSAAQLTRGPYLQIGTSSSATIRWRTDLDTDTWVRYGTDPNDLASSVDGPALTTEHIIIVSNLSPDTKYFYSIGTSQGSLLNNPDFFFVTSPLPGTPKPTRIWVLGDSGTKDNNARSVRDAYLNYAATTGPADLLLMLGDNAYNTGTDAEFQAAVFDMYPTVLENTFFYSTIGNHETAQQVNISNFPYLDMFSLPTAAEAGGLASGTERYYSFDYANIHFVCLDSQTSSRALNDPMFTWLVNDLAATSQDWIIAFWHHPPYTKGTHNSDTEQQLLEMRERALPILESAGVDLVLSGHSHVYERSYLINGHYDVSSTFNPSSMLIDGGDGREDGTGAYQQVSGVGAVYTVAGTSGQAGSGSLNHPAMFSSMGVLGSVVLDVSGGRLDALFIRSTGAIADHFTLLKDTEPPAIVCPGNLTVQCDQPTDPPDTGVATATDLSDPNPTINHSDAVAPGPCPQASVITRTWTATDAGGNTSSCIQTITVQDAIPPSLTAGPVASCYPTAALAEAAAMAATTASDNCGTVTLTATTAGDCSALITVRGTDECLNFAEVTYPTRIDNQAPALGAITALQIRSENPIIVKDCANLTWPDVVTFSVEASDNCWSPGDRPTLSLTDGLTTEVATFVDENPDGTYNFTWNARGGNWTATAAAADLCNTVAENFNLCVNQTQITGQVQLEGFVGTGTSPAHTRTITFVATDALNVILQTWVLDLANASGDTFDYTLGPVPPATVGLSAKTDWNLRRKLALTLDLNGQATANFTGNSQLRGGDIVQGPSTQNTVNVLDYSLVAASWLDNILSADITGDGSVNLFDYSILAINWATSGDPE